MQTVHFSPLARCAGFIVLALVAGACSSNSDIGPATGGGSGATGVAGALQASGGAAAGTTDHGSGGDVTATGGSGGTGVAGTSPGSGGGGATGIAGTGGAGDSGGASLGGQSAGGAAGTSNGGTTGCGMATFCDDFERSTMLGTEWMLDNPQAANTIEVSSTTQHHSGMNAVHIKFGTGAMATYIDAAKGFPFPNDTFWGRVWMYAMTGLETGHHVYIEAQSGATNKSGVRVLNTQKMTFIATNLQVGDKSGTSAVTMPQGKWSCFEWHIDGKGTVDLYLDGTIVPGTSLTGVTIPHFDKTRLGIQRYSGGTAGELWYDDYAVGTARIGCN